MDRNIYEKLLKNAWDWIDQHHVEPILVEKAFSNEGWAGTLDLFCEMDSEGFKTKRWCKLRGVKYPQPHQRVRTLIDWKFCNGFYDDMPVKLSAYFKLLEEYDYNPEAMVIGRFSKETGSLNVKDYTNEYKESLETFQLACKLFHLNFKNYLENLEQEAERQRIAKAERNKK